MRTRHLCEGFLFAALNEHDDYDALQQIKTIAKDPSADPDINLTAMNDEGKSFLYLSLEKRMHKVTDKLRFLIKHDHASLFALTKFKQTLIHAAVLSRSTEQLEYFIKLFISQKKNWMSADNDGNTPLHYAVNENNPDTSTIEFLINTIKENRPQELHSLNRNGETALAFALKKQPCDYRVVSMLAVSTHSWIKIDNNGDSALTLFAAKSISLQKNMINAMSEKVRHQFLTLYLPYYQTLIKNDAAKQTHYTNLSEQLPASTSCLKPDELKDDFTEVHKWINDLIKQITDYKASLQNVSPAYSMPHRAVVLSPISFLGLFCLAAAIYLSIRQNNESVLYEICKSLNEAIIDCWQHGHANITWYKHCGNLRNSYYDYRYHGLSCTYPPTPPDTGTNISLIIGMIFGLLAYTGFIISMILRPQSPWAHIPLFNSLWYKEIPLSYSN